MILKASTVTNLTDARYFAALGVDFMGFNVQEKHPDYVNPPTLQAIRDWVEGPAIVGEFGNTPLDVVKASVDFYHLDAVEINLLDFYPTIDVLVGVKVIGKISYEQAKSLDKLEDILSLCVAKVSYFLLSIEDLDQTKLAELKKLCLDYPILLHANILSSDLQTIWSNVQPTGFSFSGGAEEKVGVKTFDELESYFDALEPFR